MSHYIQQLKEATRKGVNAGMSTGEQFAIDCTQIALHRLGWGYDRIKRLFDLVTDISDYYADAMYMHMEQDVMQERMDRELRDIVKDHQPFASFSERYPNVRGWDYMRPVKKNG